MSLFVVRKPEDLTARRATMLNELLELAHEKLMLQLRLSTIDDRQRELVAEVMAIDERMKEIA